MRPGRDRSEYRGLEGKRGTRNFLRITFAHLTRIWQITRAVTVTGKLSGRLRQADDTKFPATDRQIGSNMIGDDAKSNAMCRKP